MCLRLLIMCRTQWFLFLRSLRAGRYDFLCDTINEESGYVSQNIKWYVVVMWSVRRLTSI